MINMNELDEAAKRIRLYVSTVVVSFGAMGALIVFVINGITADVHEDIKALDYKFTQAQERIREAQVADSIRFERGVDVLELAVTAIVEPSGSAEQRAALNELQRRRRVIPRNQGVD